MEAPLCCDPKQHIYIFSQLESIAESTISQCLEVFPKDICDYILRIKHLQGRREQVAGFLLLAEGLRTFSCSNAHNAIEYVTELKIPSKEECAYLLDFIYNEHGKPSPRNLNGVFFNISNCQRAVAVAIAPYEIGIDIECNRKINKSLIDQVCGESEKADIEFSSNPNMAFIRHWTQKEAYVKYTGTGLGQYGLHQLKDLEVELRDDIKYKTLPILDGEGFVTIVYQK